MSPALSKLEKSPSFALSPSEYRGSKAVLTPNKVSHESFHMNLTPNNMETSCRRKNEEINETPIIA